MNIDFNSIKKNFEEKANAIYHDNDRLKSLLVSVRDMVKANKQLSEIIDDLKAMVGLLVDYVKGDYHDLQKSSAIMIIVSLLYLLAPIDLIPDFLLGGYIDDIAVIGYVFKKLSEEINKYKEWKNLNPEQTVFTSDEFIEINLDEENEDIIEGEYDIFEN